MVFSHRNAHLLLWRAHFRNFQFQKLKVHQFHKPRIMIAEMQSCWVFGLELWSSLALVENLIRKLSPHGRKLPKRCAHSLKATGNDILFNSMKTSRLPFLLLFAFEDSPLNQSFITLLVLNYSRPSGRFPIAIR